MLRNRTGRFPFPIPNGWLIVAAAADLMPGEVVPLYYFGRELVLFRGTDGVPHLLDAHCPHLGAHLGVGGQVEESCLRCPFHGWKFDGASGRCVDVPYADVEYIPKTATARAYPVVERNQMIWAWHHLRDGDDHRKFLAEWDSEIGQHGGMKGAYDPAVRDKEMDRDGVAAEVIFPDADAAGVGGVSRTPFTAGLGSTGTSDPELTLAGAWAHNRWLAEFCRHSPERRAGVAIVPMHDVGQAVRLIGLPSYSCTTSTWRRSHRTSSGSARHSHRFMGQQSPMKQRRFTERALDGSLRLRFP